MWWWKHISLWLGMYAITVLLFWYESGALTTGLLFGLLSASLKTIWAWMHHHVLFKEHVPLVEVIEDGVAVEDDIEDCIHGCDGRH